MGRKQKNQDLRSKRDALKRKKLNGSKGWEENMLQQLNEEPKAKENKKRKGSKENANRLTNDSL